MEYIEIGQLLAAVAFGAPYRPSGKFVRSLSDSLAKSDPTAFNDELRDLFARYFAKEVIELNELPDEVYNVWHLHLATGELRNGSRYAIRPSPP